MSELYAPGGQWKMTLPPWTDEELKEMEDNNGIITPKVNPDSNQAREMAAGAAAPASAEVSEAVASNVAKALEKQETSQVAAAKEASKAEATGKPAKGKGDSELTPEERLAWLKKRGVMVETHEDRVNAAKKRVEAVPLRGDKEFIYMKIPADIGEAVSRVTGVVSESDSLLSLLKPVFADSTLLDAKTVERETTERLQKMMSQQAMPAPSLETMQKLGNAGGVEAYPLARGNGENGYRSVSLYIDEIGTLRQRPRNARAEKLCAAAGLNDLSIHGDAYVGRLQVGPNGMRNVDFYESELEEQSEWCQMARKTHAAEFAAISDKKPASGAGANYEWSQTDDEVEVVVTVPLPEANDEAGSKPFKQRLKISYEKGESLNVVADGLPILRLNPLFAPIDPTGCSWTVDGSDKIIITMEKRDVREWHTLTLSRSA